MRALHYTTASIFSADYRCYGYLALDDQRWRPTSSAAGQVITQFSPSGLQPSNDLGCVDPMLGEQVRRSVLIERSADHRQWCLAATVAGVRSATRQDFTGRRIRDGLHFTATGELGDQQALQEAVQVMRAIWRLAHDPTCTLDQWCSQDAFEQDLIPFPDPPELWRQLVQAGAQPVAITAADVSSMAVDPFAGLQQEDSPAWIQGQKRSGTRVGGSVQRVLTDLTRWARTVVERLDNVQRTFNRHERKARESREVFEHHSRQSDLNPSMHLEQSLQLLMQGRLREKRILL